MKLHRYPTNWISYLTAVVSLFSFNTLSFAESRISVGALLKDMTNMASMAEFPSPAYTCKQFSSYDQKSKTPGNEEWFANADCGQYLRVEVRNGRKEHVMMDAAGPGAIVRIWSANPAGVLRIYLDGSETPAIEAPMSNLLGGKYPGLPRPISGEYSKGWNLYFPIPYAKTCKVTSDQGNFYYHVNYRTYPAGTDVETFQAGLLQSMAQTIQQVAARLDNPAEYPNASNEKLSSLNIQLAAGETFSKKFRGSEAITSLSLNVSAGDVVPVLRSVLIRMTFDGNTTVEAPLGDFFGSGPGINPFASIPVGMKTDGTMYSHWFMPFKESATLELVNLGKTEAKISGALTVTKYSWTDRSMHFHAKWRSQYDVPTRPMIDWNYLSAKGQGVFAGVAFEIDNPVKDWWGEGDEKIYVDGESFPSHFGTGTEDYYGYAWCWPGVFTHAYHAQPRCDGPGNYGRTSVCRFHILDRIPFNTQFKFDMELWHWSPKSKVNMAVLPYWYAKPGATDSFKRVELADTVIQPMKAYKIYQVKGALEGENLKVLRKTGKVSPQPWDGLSNLQQLWWHAGMNPGDTLTVGFDAPEAGRYEVFGRFVKAKDYGIHQLSVNGKDAGTPIDFYNPDVVTTKERSLGIFDLKKGQNEFSATVVGANEKAIKAYMFGLDYLRLRPVE